MQLESKKIIRIIFLLMFFFFCSATIFSQRVVPYQEDSFVLKDFKFSDGSMLDSLRLHYYYVGKPHVNKQGQIDNAVLIMHGTGGSGQNFLTENFAGQLFKTGQILDADKYFIILPDGIGHGKSSKPSEGLRMKFPAYTYDDMVDADYLLLTKHLNVQHAGFPVQTAPSRSHYTAPSF